MSDDRQRRVNLPGDMTPRFTVQDISEVPQPERVPETEFSRSRGAVKPLSSREWVAVWFAASLLVLIFAISLTLLLQWMVPVPPLSSTGEQGGALDAYKALTALIDERISRFFDLTVTKTLVPIFTTILGFLLGRRTKED